MSNIFDAVSVIRRGKLSKQHVYPPDKVPIQVKMNQDTLVDVILIERDSWLASETSKFLTKGGENDNDQIEL